MKAGSLATWLIGIGVALTATAPLVYAAVVLPLSPQRQAQVSLVLLAVGLATARRPTLRPLVLFLSTFTSLRYFHWRVTSTLYLENGLDAAVGVPLLMAELYGLVILLLGYFQTIEFEPRPMPAPTRVFHIDIFIPTYNEPSSIVRRTVIGAQAIEYARKRVFVLDDGRRPEIERMARELGCEYIARDDNRHAKAGNLNYAMGLTGGELIAIFDADHVPVKNFLKQTVAYFEDPQVALVQTAQHFFNPDPYEHNLRLTGRVAPEQNFFYHVIQPGNDFWNSAFFCGSCAVLRRSAIAGIGGFRTQTVTEDAHTAMTLHANGWRSVYVPEPLAAGLSAETYSAHVGQRMRWARGMAQILRTDCPLFKAGLSLPQRLNYFNAMVHFFFGIPRLILILAPLSFLLLGARPIHADALAVAAYILPHIGLSAIANSIISKQYRHSFWAGVYEVSIAPYTAAVTLLALVNPMLGKFNVTGKGGLVDAAHFDSRTSRVTLALIALSVAALTAAFPARLVLYWLNPADPSALDAILFNSLWVLANLVTLIAAACVAYEQPQRRRLPRIQRNFACSLAADDRRLDGRTRDVSESGVLIRLASEAAPPERCTVAIAADGYAAFESSAVKVRHGAAEAAYRFEGLTAESHRRLVELIFCGEGSWSAKNYPPDNLARSFWYLLTTFWRVTRPPHRAARGLTGEAPVGIGAPAAVPLRVED